MAGLPTLLSLSVVMAVASFLAGLLPLSISLTRSQLRLISIVGMGVLVGTSLIVIIPEGVETLYSSSEHSASHSKRIQGTSDVGVRWAHPPTLGQSIRSLPQAPEYHRTPRVELFDAPDLVVSNSIDGPPKTPTEPDVIGILQEEEGSADEHDEEHEEESPHNWIGVALITGFILMFLIDKLPHLASSPEAPRKTHNIALNQIGRRFNLSSSPQPAEEEVEGFVEGTQTQEKPKRGLATTIGLIIHAAADGIALGASSSTAQTKLSLVIFFAIMIHKAPAAFGLTSILLQQGLSKKMARAHLILFSLAAPIGAILTWMAARVLGAGTTANASNTKWWTGVLLLFSAGTFLYVAMHSLQEVFGGRQEKHDTNGHASGSLERRDSFDQPEEQKLSFRDLAAAVFGMILPMFLQVRHSH